MPTVPGTGWPADDPRVDAALLVPVIRGTLPQAYVHAGMLECAVRLSAAPPGLRS